MEWIDAHAHLSDRRFEDTLPKLIDECARAGITRFVLGGVDPEEWERQIELEKKYPYRIFRSFGLHPWWVANHASKEETLQAGLATLRRRIGEVRPIAVGETGLDFHPRFSESTHAVQERIFREQIRIAFGAGLPLVLHIVRAHERAISILEEEKRGASKIGYRGIVHSFGDEPRIARRYLDLGLVPSISAAVITREKGPAFAKLQQTVITLSAKEFVLETDAPDQPPHPRAGDGELNPPVNLLRVAEAIAAIRGEPATAVLDQSRDTVLEVFGI